MKKIYYYLTLLLFTFIGQKSIPIGLLTSQLLVISASKLAI